MRRFLGPIVVTSALMLLAPSRVLAGDPAEVELVRRGVADVLSARNDGRTPSTMPQRTQRAAALLERYVDLTAFEARVLADIEPSLTPAQRKTLSESLRALIAARIAARLPDVPSSAPRLGTARTENGETHLRVTYRSAPTAGSEDDVEVDLVFAKAGAPVRIVDATIAGASLSKNLRASVNKVMRKDGFEGLSLRLTQLRERTTAGPHKSSDLTL